MHVLTENEIRNVAGRIDAGGEFTVPEQTILTPLARDYLRLRGIRIIDPHPPRNTAGSVPAEAGDDELVDAMADEITRLLREKGGAGDVPAPPDPATALSLLPSTSSPGSAGPSNRAVVWAIGGDRPGILAAVAELLGRSNANILEINQTILSGVFAMVVIVDLKRVEAPFAELKAALETLGKTLGINLSAQRDEIFQYMHRI